MIDANDDRAFFALVNEALTCGLTKQELAHEFDASIPTIERWIAGHNAPHPLVRKHVINFLQNRMKLSSVRLLCPSCGSNPDVDCICRPGG